MRLLAAGGAAFVVAYFASWLESRWFGPSPRPVRHGIASAITAMLAFAAFAVVADPGHPVPLTPAILLGLFTGLFSWLLADRRWPREFEAGEASGADPKVTRGIDP